MKQNGIVDLMVVHQCLNIKKTSTAGLRPAVERGIAMKINGNIDYLMVDEVGNITVVRTMNKTLYSDELMNKPVKGWYEDIKKK